MAVNYGFVQTALNTSTGTQTLSDSNMSVTPKLAIMWLTEGSSAGTDIADAAIGYGATDGTNQWAMSVTSQDNQASTSSTRILDETSCIALLDGGSESTKLVNATFDSFGTGSVTIDHQVAPGAGYLINVILMGGDDLDVLVGSIDPTDTDSGTTDITTTFQPEVGIFAYCERDDNTSGAGHIRFSVGYMSYISSTITQRVVALRESTGGGSGQPSMARRTDRIASYLTTTGTEVAGFEVTAVGATSVTITTRTSGAASRDLPYVLISTGGQGVWVGDVDSPTSTGDNAVTGVGFNPAVIMPVVSTLYTSDVDANDNTAGGLSIGAAVTDMASNDLEGSSRISIEDAADPTNTESSTESSIIRVTQDDGTDGIAASFTSFDSDGFTLNWSLVDGSNAWAGIGLAFAEAPSSGVTGTLTATLGSLTVSSAAAVDVDGTLSKTLGSLTVSSAGSVDVVGSLNKTLDALTLSATGGITTNGTVNATLGELTVDSSATVDVDGSLDATLGALVVSSAGSVDVDASLDTTLGTLTVSSNASVDVTGNLDVTLGALTVSATAGGGTTGQLDATLGALTVSSSATVDVDAESNITLGALTVSSSGSVDVTGSLDVTLGALTLSATGDSDNGVTGNLSTTLGSLTVTSAASVDVDATLSTTLGALTSAATGSVDVTATTSQTLGALTVSSTGVIGTPPVTGDLDVTLGTLTVSSAGSVDIDASLTATLGALTISSTASVDVVGSLNATLGSLTISATGASGSREGTLTQTLGALTVSSSATVGLILTVVNGLVYGPRATGSVKTVRATGSVKTES